MKRQEFVFLYESSFANANGDPLNDNRPRIDEDTGLQFVTMYRIKRTVRDYLKLMQIVNQTENQEILFQEVKNEDMTLKELGDILQEGGHITEEDILNHFIDVRLFGGVIAVKKNNMALQGPVQVSYGKSLHRVTEKEIQISAVMPTRKGAREGTLGLSYIVPYAAIAVDGTVNQYNAEKTKLTEEDLDLFFDSLWNGTAHLRTTSKNQKPLLLIKVVFKDEFKNTYLGNLKDYLSLNSQLEDEEIRSVKDYSVDITELVDKLNSLSDRIEEISIVKDLSLNLDTNSDWVSELENRINTKVV